MNKWIRIVGYSIGLGLIVVALVYLFLVNAGMADENLMSVYASEYEVSMHEMYLMTTFGAALIILPLLAVGSIIICVVYRYHRRHVHRLKWEEYNKTILPEIPGVYSEGYNYNPYAGKKYAGLAILFAILSIVVFPLILFPLALFFGVVTVVKGETLAGMMAIFIGGLFFCMSLLYPLL